MQLQWVAWLGAGKISFQAFCVYLKQITSISEFFMKRVIRKFGLSLVPAMALAALFTACGDDSGSNGDEKDSVVTVPSDIKLADGNKVVCDEDMEGVVAATADAGYRKCHDGQWEKVSRKEALTADKIIGEVDEAPDEDLDENPDVDQDGDEEEGFTFPSCTSRKEGSTLNNPDDGKTYRCEDGQWVVVKKTGSSSSSAAPDVDPDTDPDVTPGTVPGSNSSTGEGDEGSSPSVTPGTVPGSNSSSSEGGEGSSPSVTPGTVPGSNSSTGEEEGPSDELYYCEADGELYMYPENCTSYVGSSASESDEGSSPSVNPGTDPDVTPDPVPGSNAWDYLNQDMLAAGKYGEFTDTRDGQVYKTIKICDEDNKNCQTWMAQNLNYGDVRSWCGGGSGTTEGDCSKYGRLYTWKVAMDKADCGAGNYCNNSYEGTQGVCPTGWHLPSDADWRTLFENVGGDGSAGQKLKANTSLWTSYSGVTNDDSFGFAVLPAGYRRYDRVYFNYEGERAYFWSSTESYSDLAFSWFFGFNSGNVGDGWNDKDYAFSVRCVQNSPDQGSEGDDPDVTPGTDPGSNSSTGEGEGSSPSVTPGSSPSVTPSCSSVSEEEVSSPSVTPGTVPGANSSTGEGEGSSPSVTPDPVPGSNSSTGEEDVQPDGFYSNSSNCPEGLTCKYATTTDYLNSSKTYGEILDTRDGQVYKTIEICDEDNKNCQIWMAQNLNYAYTGVKFNYAGYTSDSTSWCYGNDPSNCATYGRLYTWAAAVDSVAIYKNYSEECGYGKLCTRFSATALATSPVRGVCPSGWHLPSSAEWSALYTNVGGTDYAGQKLKANTSLWTPYSGVTNDDSFGFSVLPAGGRSRSGDFDRQGYGAYFWSSTELEGSSYSAWNQRFYYVSDYVGQDYDGYKNKGFSVRCLKD